MSDNVKGDVETHTRFSPRSHRSASPDITCPICLGELSNKSVTNTCTHQFCFGCLLEWAKIKAECPMCKQRFTSIIHSIRSNDDYDEVRVDSIVEPALDVLRIEIRALRPRVDPPRPFSMDMLWSPSPSSTARMTRHQSHLADLESRRNIYRQGLWVRNTEDRVRESSPHFYRTNPGQVHRLIPWLTRELSVLLDVSLEHEEICQEILAILNNYAIRSRQFRRQIRPWLGHRLDHFIHEFYNFAISPYDMATYDVRAQYYPTVVHLETDEADNNEEEETGASAVEEHDIARSDSDMEEIVSWVEQSSSRPIERTRPFSINIHPLSYPHPTIYPNCVFHTPFHVPQIFAPIHNNGSNVSGPSSRNDIEIAVLSSDDEADTRQAQSSSHECETRQAQSSSHESDVEIIATLPPRHLRTPELIDLGSDSSDSDVTILPGSNSIVPKPLVLVSPQCVPSTSKCSRRLSRNDSIILISPDSSPRPGRSHSTDSSSSSSSSSSKSSSSASNFSTTMRRCKRRYKRRRRSSKSKPLKKRKGVRQHKYSSDSVASSNRSRTSSISMFYSFDSNPSSPSQSISPPPFSPTSSNDDIEEPESNSVAERRSESGTAESCASSLSSPQYSSPPQKSPSSISTTSAPSPSFSPPLSPSPSSNASTSPGNSPIYTIVPTEHRLKSVVRRVTNGTNQNPCSPQ